jgi:hypothetical protein
LLTGAQKIREPTTIPAPSMVSADESSQLLEASQSLSGTKHQDEHIQIKIDTDDAPVEGIGIVAADVKAKKDEQEVRLKRKFCENYFAFPV